MTSRSRSRDRLRQKESGRRRSYSRDRSLSQGRRDVQRATNSTKHSSSPRRRRSRSASGERRGTRRHRLRSRSSDRGHVRARRSRSRSLTDDGLPGRDRRGYASDASMPSDGKPANYTMRKKDKKTKKDKKKKSKTSSCASPARVTDTGKDEAGQSTDGITTDPTAVSTQNNNATSADDVRNFFARLKQQESAKETVGTVHASGVKVQSATAISSSDQWECSKAGCGHKNSKYASACSKCGAMKRMSEWR